MAEQSTQPKRQKAPVAIEAMRAAIDRNGGSAQLDDDPSLIVVDLGTWTSLNLRAERGDQLYFESLLTHGVQGGWIDRDELRTWKALHRIDPESVVASLEALEQSELLE